MSALSASSSRSRSEPDGGPDADRESTSAGLSVGYEVDLWGRVAADVRGARANFRRDAVRLRRAAHLDRERGGRRPISRCLPRRERSAIARENLAIAERVLGMVESRFRNGVATSLDVSQQTMTVLTQRTALLPLEMQAAAAAVGAGTAARRDAARLRCGRGEFRAARDSAGRDRDCLRTAVAPAGPCRRRSRSRRGGCGSAYRSHFAVALDLAVGFGRRVQRRTAVAHQSRNQSVGRAVDGPHACSMPAGVPHRSKRRARSSASPWRPMPRRCARR